MDIFAIITSFMFLVCLFVIIFSTKTKDFVTIQDSYFRKWLLDPMSKDNVWVKIKLSHNYLCQMSQLLFVMPLKRKFEIFFASVMNCKGNFRQATPYQKTELKAQNLTFHSSLKLYKPNKNNFRDQCRENLRFFLHLS